MTTDSVSGVISLPNQLGLRFFSTRITSLLCAIHYDRDVCRFVCVRVHFKDACLDNLTNVCDNFPVGKHLHAQFVICGLFGLAEVLP